MSDTMMLIGEIYMNCELFIFDLLDFFKVIYNFMKLAEVY